eukprot:1105049-Rhodomonas_salina.2
MSSGSGLGVGGLLLPGTSGGAGSSLADVPLPDGVRELAVEGTRVAVGRAVNHDVEVVVEEPGSCRTVGAELALLEEGLLEAVGQ